nr:hypothetical protein [Arthrospira sp. PLM2.Bin9]
MSFLLFCSEQLFSGQAIAYSTDQSLSSAVFFFLQAFFRWRSHPISVADI